MQEKKRFFRLVSVLMIMLCILSIMAFSMLITDTTTRYIKREKDEIRSYYTGLYCDNTGDGSAVALENGVGYVDFKIMNYIDEDVTKRDITYDIRTLDTFYDVNGKEIVDSNSNGNNVDELASADNLYVKDVWNIPQLIGKDSYKYNVDIIKNDGETRDGLYLFSYEERAENGGAVGKVHNVTVRIERKDDKDVGEFSGSTEDVSLVIQLSSPYKEVYVVDITISNRLIVFSQRMVSEFEVEMMKVQTQTFDIFGYKGDNSTNPNEIGGTFTSKPFKVVFEWDNMILNESEFQFFHNNQQGILGPNNGSNNGIDLSEPYIVEFNQTSDHGTLTMYVPQSSNFTFDALITDKENAYLVANVYVYNTTAHTTTGDNPITIPVGYTVYDLHHWGGYTDIDLRDESATEGTRGLAIIYFVKSEDE